jgi:histidinol-phosphate aminotransferase
VHAVGATGDVDDGLDDAVATWEGLLGLGVLVRDVGIDHHLRVTAGTQDETTAFLRALARLTGGMVQQ